MRIPHYTRNQPPLVRFDQRSRVQRSTGVIEVDRRLEAGELALAEGGEGVVGVGRVVGEEARFVALVGERFGVG